MHNSSLIFTQLRPQGPSGLELIKRDPLPCPAYFPAYPWTRKKGPAYFPHLSSRVRPQEEGPPQVASFLVPVPRATVCVPLCETHRERKTSSFQAWLSATWPQWPVVSSQENNNLGTSSVMIELQSLRCPVRCPPASLVPQSLPRCRGPGLS